MTSHHEPTGDSLDLQDEPPLAAERRRRMAEVHRKASPTDTEIERARQRLASPPRRLPPPLARVWALGLAQGFVAGLVTLAAVSFVGAKVLPALSALRSPRVALERPLGDAPPEERSDRNAVPAVVRSPAPPVAPPAVAFDDAPAPPAPKSAEKANTPEKMRVPASSRRDDPASAVPIPLPVPTLGAVESATVEVSAPSTSGAWTQVAEALAARDYARADAALSALASSPEVTTRDAAALSRAELAIARGAGASARPEIERLSRTGSTPLIRRRARELLDRHWPGAAPL